MSCAFDGPYTTGVSLADPAPIPAGWQLGFPHGVETAIESGLRWGELSELRVKDLYRTRVLTVSRTVVELNPKYYPSGGRFLVKDYPKDREYRCLKLSEQIVDKLRELIQVKDLGAGDLLFGMREADQSKPHLRAVPDDRTASTCAPHATPPASTTWTGCPRHRGRSWNPMPPRRSRRPRSSSPTTPAPTSPRRRRPGSKTRCGSWPGSGRPASSRPRTGAGRRRPTCRGPRGPWTD